MMKLKVFGSDAIIYVRPAYVTRAVQDPARSAILVFVAGISEAFELLEENSNVSK